MEITLPPWSYQKRLFEIYIGFFSNFCVNNESYFSKTSRNQSKFTLKKSTSIPVQLTVTSTTTTELPESLRPPCCDRVAAILENIAKTPSMANRAFAISTSMKDHDPYCEKLIGLNEKKWTSSTSMNSQQPNMKSRMKPKSYASQSAAISKRRMAATLR